MEDINTARALAFFVVIASIIAVLVWEIVRLDKHD